MLFLLLHRHHPAAPPRPRRRHSLFFSDDDDDQGVDNTSNLGGGGGEAEAALPHAIMPVGGIEYGRFGIVLRNRHKHQPAHRASARKPRQEICAPLKWMCFMLNFVTFLVGVTCLALGLYLCIKDPRGVSELADVILNPAIVLTATGLITCIIALVGSFGALRDNVFLLKTYALCVFFCYIVVVIATFLLFMLFYSDTTDGLSAHSILLYSIERYHSNKNLADFYDYMQEQLECCGAGSASQGYKDWGTSALFNCSTTNPYPERCGVPFSCCRRAVVSEAAGSSNPLLPAMRSLSCWQNALTRRPQDVEAEIHARGCLQPLRMLFESHAVHVGAVVAVLILPVCLSVCIANVLAKQIDHQRYLLDRESRRHERRQRREKHRFRDPFAQQLAPPQLRTKSASQATTLEKQSPTATSREDPNDPMMGMGMGMGMGIGDRRSGGCRASSNSPTRKAARKQQRREQRRRRSIAVPDARTQHWVLQQSDLVGQQPLA